MAETDLTAEEAGSNERLQLYSDAAPTPENPYGFADGGYLQNQMRQGRDVGVIGRLARRLALFVQGLANTVAANAVLSAEDAENTRLDRIATAENVVKAAEEVTKAAEQAQRLVGTSTTAVATGTGTKTFATQPNKHFGVGQFLTIVSTAVVTRWMHGQVTAYNVATGALTVNVGAIGPTTGTVSSWNIYTASPAGPQGIQGIPGIATMPYLARSANTQLVAGDSASLIDATGTFTQTFAAPAALGANWYCFYKNAGTGQITIPASDGVTNWIMYPGEMRLFQCDGTTLRSEVLNPFSATFIASGNFIKPPGYVQFEGMLWAGGGGGGGSGGGGGGGACSPFVLKSSELAQSTPFVIGAGGPAGNGSVGAGNSTFGPVFSGGGWAGPNQGGSGGGMLSGATSSQGGGPSGGLVDTGGDSSFGGGGGARAGVSTSRAGSSVYGGGGGQTATGGSLPGGNSVYGGAGGASAGNSSAPGTSVFGGNGGALGQAGFAPGGGGGAGAAGARGELRLWGVS